MTINVLQQLLSLSKQLFPTGRAFRIPANSLKEKVEKGLLASEERAYNDAVGILDSILPDNDNFTAEDATRWEQRLGMIVNPDVDLEDRKAAIIRKYNHPGTILARQSAGYIQEQLQLAGFDVYVHENIPEQSIIDLLQSNSLIPQWGGFEFGELEFGDALTIFDNLLDHSEFGELEFGTFEWGQIFYNQKIANSIDHEKDIYFDIGTDAKKTFYIGAAIKGEFATVDTNRRDEFRSIVLKTKPTETIGFALINYT
jgi:uncharacterized protein YmfQ (DUF2313 family)